MKRDCTTLSLSVCLSCSWIFCFSPYLQELPIKVFHKVFLSNISGSQGPKWTLSQLPMAIVPHVPAIKLFAFLLKYKLLFKSVEPAFLIKFKIGFSNVIYSCKGKAEFSAAIAPFLDPSGIILICWFSAQETFHMGNRKFKRTAFIWNWTFVYYKCILIV